MGDETVVIKMDIKSRHITANNHQRSMANMGQFEANPNISKLAHVSETNQIFPQCLGLVCSDSPLYGKLESEVVFILLQ